MSPADGSGSMFDRIAPRYDLLNRLVSLGLDRGWRRRLVAEVCAGAPSRVLDVGARRTSSSGVPPVPEGALDALQRAVYERLFTSVNLYSFL